MISRPKITNNLEQELRAIQEQEEKENELSEDKSGQHHQHQGAVPKKRFFKPLPEAEYRSSRVAIEKEITTEDEPKDLPKKFMTVSSTEGVVSYNYSYASFFKKNLRFVQKCKYILTPYNYKGPQGGHPYPEFFRKPKVFTCFLQVLDS